MLATAELQMLAAVLASRWSLGIGRERPAERLLASSAIVSARRLTSALLGIGLDAALGGVGWGITVGCTNLSAQDAVIQLKVRAANTPNFRIASQPPLFCASF
jgi:hypothetical protein